MWRCEARRLSWDQGGVCLEVLDEDEAVFLFHEIVVRDLYCQHGIRVGRGSLVVDVGANVGIFAALCVQRGAHVLAVEPAPEAFAVLRRNLAGCGRATCVQAALADRPAAAVELTYFADRPGESTRHVEEARRRWRACKQRAVEGATCTVPALTLTELLRPLDPELPIALVKVDVEGDELRVLQGCDAATMARIEAFAVEVADTDGGDDGRGGRLEAVCALLRAHGFEVHVQQQATCTTATGYRMVVPKAARLYYVYGRRLGGEDGSDDASRDDGSASGGDDSDSDSDGDGDGVGDGDDSGSAAGATRAPPGACAS